MPLKYLLPQAAATLLIHSKDEMETNTFMIEFNQSAIGVNTYPAPLGWKFYGLATL
jgi:hypothetical protein